MSKPVEQQDDNELTLDALGFLQLSERKLVTRIDLAEAGDKGIVYACSLTTAEQQKIVRPGKSGRVKMNKDSSMELDWSMLIDNAGPLFLEMCMVTDSKGGQLLNAAFKAAENGDGEPVESISFPISDLVLMSDIWKRELGSRSKMIERLEAMPNAVTSLIVKRVRKISGMDSADKDALEEKKDG